LVLSFKLKGAQIEADEVFSDAMSTDLIDALSGIFVGCRLEKADMTEALDQVEVPEAMKAAFSDVRAWIQTLPF